MTTPEPAPEDTAPPTRDEAAAPPVAEAAPRRRRGPGTLRRTLAQTGMELRLAWRNGENLLVVLGIPVGLLLLLATVDVIEMPRGVAGGTPATNTAERVAFLAPGILALSVISAAMVSLAIGTGFERAYLVLKRLGATPLRRGELVAAKAIAVVCTEVIALAAITAVAAALGWRPELDRAWLSLPALILGTAAFAGIGMTLAGTLRAVATLAIANALFVFLLLCSGLVIPLDALPGPLAGIARALPAAPLAQWLRSAFGGPALGALDGIVLVLWALAAPLLAAKTFRWNP